MRSFIAMCLFGAIVSAMAMPQQMHHHQLVGGSRPPGPQVHPHPWDRPSQEIDPEFEINAEMWEFIGHINDFIQLWPHHEIRQIVRSHMSDPELRATMNFIRSRKFEEIIHTIVDTSEVQAIGRYMGEANWPWIQAQVYEVVQEMEDQGLFAVAKRSTGGLNGLIDALVAILPKEQLRALFDEKMANSTVFRGVVEIFSSDELVSLINTARQSPVIREQLAVLLQNGVDVDKITESKLALFGL